MQSDVVGEAEWVDGAGSLKRTAVLYYSPQIDRMWVSDNFWMVSKFKNEYLILIILDERSISHRGELLSTFF